jgi:hypothetical protein
MVSVNQGNSPSAFREPLSTRGCDPCSYRQFHWNMFAGNSGYRTRYPTVSASTICSTGRDQPQVFGWIRRAALTSLLPTPALAALPLRALALLAALLLLLTQAGGCGRDGAAGGAWLRGAEGLSHGRKGAKEEKDFRRPPAGRFRSGPGPGAGLAHRSAPRSARRRGCGRSAGWWSPGWCRSARRCARG